MARGPYLVSSISFSGDEPSWLQAAALRIDETGGSERVGESQFSVVSAAADADSDGSGLPDNPFVALPGSSSFWFAQVAFEEGGTGVLSCAVARWDHDASGQLGPVTLVLGNPELPNSLAVVEAPRELTLEGETAVLVLATAKDLRTLLGPDVAQEIPVPATGSLVTGGMYVEISILITTDGGATFDEIDPSRLTDFPLWLALYGIAPQEGEQLDIISFPTYVGSVPETGLRIIAEEGVWHSDHAANVVVKESGVTAGIVALSVFAPFEGLSAGDESDDSEGSGTSGDTGVPGGFADPTSMEPSPESEETTNPGGGTISLMGSLQEVWVDFNYPGMDGDGSYAEPFRTLGDGLLAVTSGGTIKIKGNGVSDEHPFINQAVRIEAVGGSARIGGAVTLPEYAELGMSIGGPGSGSTDPPPGLYSMDGGSTAAINATPYFGSRFVEWRITTETGIEVIAAASTELAMDGDYQALAVFERETPDLADLGTSLLDQFDALDVDSSGDLTFTETQAADYPPSQAEFDALDLDASGALTRAELEEARWTSNYDMTATLNIAGLDTGLVTASPSSNPYLPPGVYLLGESVTLTANEMDASGKYFQYWENPEISHWKFGYPQTTRFYPDGELTLKAVGDMTLTPVYQVASSIVLQGTYTGDTISVEAPPSCAVSSETNSGIQTVTVTGPPNAEVVVHGVPVSGDPYWDDAGGSPQGLTDPFTVRLNGQVLDLYRDSLANRMTINVAANQSMLGGEGGGWLHGPSAGTSCGMLIDGGVPAWSAPYGTSVGFYVFAEPKVGSQFHHWNLPGGGTWSSPAYVGNASEDWNGEAVFEQMCLLSVYSQYEDWGEVYVSIDGGPEFTVPSEDPEEAPAFHGIFPYGTQVALRAEDDHFGQWVGDQSGSQLTKTFTLAQNPTTVAGKFEGKSVQCILTFDDGPFGDIDTGQSRKVIEALKKGYPTTEKYAGKPDLKAVFFVQTHRNVPPHGGGSTNGAAVINLETKRGHKVEIHTAGKGTHEYDSTGRHDMRLNEPAYYVGPNGEVTGSGNLVGANALESDMTAGIRRLSLEELAGKAPSFARPIGGYGGSNPDVHASYAAVGLRMLLWDVDSTDNSGATTANAIRNALAAQIANLDLSKTSPYVFLFHDLKSITIDHLADEIDGVPPHLTTIVDAFWTRRCIVEFVLPK